MYLNWLLFSIVFMESLLLSGSDRTVSIFASVGEDVTLNCSLNIPPEGIEEVSWRKSNGSKDIMVLLYRNNEISLNSSDEQYSDRVELFTEEIPKGNLSLKLKSARVEDTGDYTCQVVAGGISDQTFVFLKFLLLSGSYRIVSIFASEGEDVTLNCSLNSHIPLDSIQEVSWRKFNGSKDIMVLLYRNNEISLNSSDEQYRHRVELFTEEIPKGNLSLKLKSARVEDRGYYICQAVIGGMSDQTFVFLKGVYCKDFHYAAAKRRLFEDLGIEKNDFQISRIWPLVLMFQPVQIHVDLYMSSIIDVNEKAQSLTIQVIMITAWPNCNLQWDKWDYCGINTFVVPRKSFWNPDIGIKESIKTEYGTKESPYVKLFSDGITASPDILSLTTACKMDLYRFPFDTQRCNITFQSTVYSVEEITIYPLTNASNIKLESNGLFQAQGEWELLDMNTTKNQIHMWFTMDQLIYQITIKRRPLLYVINIIVPVFLFLVLDVMSFLIDASGQDKLNFKVTLLLAISVFLLILNDTLPSTADKPPLIGIYCSGIFLLIGISLMETIVVNFLRGKKVKRRSAKPTAPVSGQDDSVKDLQSPPDSVIGQTEETTNECHAAAQPKQQKKTCVSWTRVARIIDVTFFILYIITIIAFLTVIGKLWFPST